MDVNILAISKFDKLRTVLGRFQIKSTEDEVMFGKAWSRESTDFSGFLASSHESDSSSVIESVKFLWLSLSSGRTVMLRDSNSVVKYLRP